MLAHFLFITNNVRKARVVVYNATIFDIIQGRSKLGCVQDDVDELDDVDEFDEFSKTK